jgi:hypothetical protein
MQGYGQLDEAALPLQATPGNALQGLLLLALVLARFW